MVACFELDLYSDFADLCGSADRFRVRRAPATRVCSTIRAYDGCGRCCEDVGSVQRSWIKAGRSSADLDQVRKDASNLLGFLDNSDDFHFGSALGTHKRGNRGAQPSYTFARRRAHACLRQSASTCTVSGADAYSGESCHLFRRMIATHSE